MRNSFDAISEVDILNNTSTLESEERSYELYDSLDYIDNNAALNILALKDGVQYLSYNLERCVGLNQEIADTLINEGFVSEVFYYKHKFDELICSSELAKELIEKKGKITLVAWNLDCFEDLNFLQDETLRRGILKRTGVNFIHRRKRYEYLQILLEHIPEDVAKEFFNVNEEKALYELDHLIYLQLYNQAYAYMNCLNIVDIHVSDDIKKQCIKKMEEEDKTKDIKNRKDYKHVDLEREILSFYGAELLEVEINEVLGDTLSTRVNREVSFRDNVLVEDIKDQIPKMFSWLRTYFIRAVSSEIEHQDSDYMMHRLPEPRGLSADELIRHLSDQELREYFYESKDAFTGFYPSKEHGGDAWKHIADLSFQMMKDGLSKIEQKILIDRFIQLEHNKGMVFDKDPDRLTSVLGEEFFKALDTKRDAISLEDLYERSKELLGEEHQGVLDLKRMLSTLANIKKKGARGRGD